MSLRELLRKFFIVGRNLNAKLVAAKYLSSLSDNDKKNYKVFESFSRECSSMFTVHSLRRRRSNAGGNNRATFGSAPVLWRGRWRGRLHSQLHAPKWKRKK